MITFLQHADEYKIDSFSLSNLPAYAMLLGRAMVLESLNFLDVSAHMYNIMAETGKILPAWFPSQPNPKEKVPKFKIFLVGFVPVGWVNCHAYMGPFLDAFAMKGYS